MRGFIYLPSLRHKKRRSTHLDKQHIGLDVNKCKHIKKMNSLVFFRIFRFQLVEPKYPDRNKKPNRNRNMLFGPVLGSKDMNFSVLGSLGSSFGFGSWRFRNHAHPTMLVSIAC